MRKWIVALLLAAALGACAPITPSVTPATALPSALPPATAGPTQAVTPTEPPMTVAPTAAATQTAEAPACEVPDLKASHGLVDGAAGSVFTEVVLEAAVTCSIDAVPGLRLRDASGAVIATEPASVLPGRVDLVGGVAYTGSVKLDNWCAPEPNFPVRLLILIDGSELFVTGSSFPDEGDVPECLADRGISLEGTAWMPST